MMSNSGLWRHADFMKLWGGQTFSNFGSLIGKLVLPFLIIYNLHATPLQVAWVRAAELVPGMLAGVLLGVWIDRVKRKPLLIGTDFCRALLLLSIPVALIEGHLTLLQVILVAAGISILTVAFEASYEAYLPTLVKPELIVDANSKLAASSSIAEVTGFGIAGVLFQTLGGAMAIVIDAITFLGSALSLLWIRTGEPEMPPLANRESVLKEAKLGFQVLIRHKLLFHLLGIEGLNSIYNGVLGTIYMLYISRHLQIAPSAQGILYAVGGISSLVGAAMAEPVLRKLGLGKTLWSTSLLGVIGILMIPSATGPYWLLMIFMLLQQLLGDGPETLYNIQVTSLRQMLTPNHLLGRVNSTWRVTSWMFLLLGTLAGGVLAEVIGLRLTFFLAIGVRFSGFLWLYFSPIRESNPLSLAPRGFL